MIEEWIRSESITKDGKLPSSADEIDKYTPGAVVVEETSRLGSKGTSSKGKAAPSLTTSDTSYTDVMSVDEMKPLQVYREKSKGIMITIIIITIIVTNTIIITTTTS